MTVNSWNEWDPLREVIVGSVRGAAEMGYEPAFSPYYARSDPARRFRGAPVPQSVADDAERQLDGFAELLQRRGIVVRRPDGFDQNVAAATPDWAVGCGRAIACPRDVLLVIGDEIIEAPMAQRGRYFEFRAYRSLIKDYFRAGARWTAAPKPLMGDALYHDHAPFDMNDAPLLTEFEPAFDAACFARFGRDIFWQPDLVSNAFGAAWLARHLGPGFRIHTIRFREHAPVHIDATFVPIRPGLVLTNPQRPCTNGVLELLAKNDWRLVDAPPSVRSGRSPSRDVSNWISMNILMLDERTAVVEAAEKAMMALLQSLGCETIPCAFDRVYPFGGGLHCATCDVHREGTLQSYFPSLDQA
ncbi:MAG: amidinotransferase [Alphaproteobacteria bacterium]|nr:amidinotransferase [Alphaproteobacteria bacterium]MBV9694339.1 amidinotransferase [Alphaproteobacteria bacterium]